jgi:hypothetical protein
MATRGEENRRMDVKVDALKGTVTLTDVKPNDWWMFYSAADAARGMPVTQSFPKNQEMMKEVAAFFENVGKEIRRAYD